METRTKAKMTHPQAVAILKREKPLFLEGLSEAEVAAVVAKASIWRYAAHTAITNEASGANHLFLLLEGAGRGYALTAAGERIGLGWFHTGQTMGWAAFVSKRLDYIVSFETVKTSLMLVWDRVTIQSLAVTLPRLMENALQIVYGYVVTYRTLHLAAVCDTGTKRLAQVVGHLAKGMGHRVDHGFELHISNEELANEAHVTVFTVSRLMREWRRQGLLTKHRGSVLVHLPDALLRVET